MVLLSITPLLDGVLRLDIIAPFHTSGPPLLQFHLAIEQWGFSVTLSFESQLYYQHYPISFTVGPFTNILTTVSDEVNGVVYAPTTVNWYKDKFGIVCDYYSNGEYVKPTSVTFISLGI